MAVFWKHIKGTTNAQTNDDGLWTWINWSAVTENTSEELQKDNRTMSWAPEIWCKYGNGSTNENDHAVNLGRIITSDNLHQEIYETIKLNTVDLNNNKGELIFQGYDDDDDSSTVKFHGSLKLDPFCTIKTWLSEEDKSQYTYTLQTTHTGWWINTGPITQEQGPVNLGGLITIYNKLHVYNGSTLQITLDNEDGKCEAKYFNATSDKRAKENIQPILGSALDIIKQVQVYTFNYKDQQRRTIGLIAQELIDKPLDDVNFVFNPQASGVNGDYMNISEGKLVYLLLKAIQEQQEEIDTLKKRLESLEGN